jgi:hypothetical protein
MLKREQLIEREREREQVNIYKLEISFLLIEFSHVNYFNLKAIKNYHNY